MDSIIIKIKEIREEIDFTHNNHGNIITRGWWEEWRGQRHLSILYTYPSWTSSPTTTYNG
jgi:hypothetical protein